MDNAFYLEGFRFYYKDHKKVRIWHLALLRPSTSWKGRNGVHGVLNFARPAFAVRLPRSRFVQAGTNRRLNSDVWQPGPLGFRYTKGGGHTTLEEYENAALFLQVDLPSTLIRHENAALFLRLSLSSTLIRHENAALFITNIVRVFSCLGLKIIY